MINYLPGNLLISLVLTVLIECPIGFALGMRKPGDVANMFLINAVTNPIVVYTSFVCSLLLGRTGAIAVLAALEVGALVSEGLFYRKVNGKKKINPFLLSLILNGCSFAAGEIYKIIF